MTLEKSDIWNIGHTIYKDDDENVELQAYSYEEAEDELSGALHPIETEEEWDMVEEVLNTFIQDENM